MKLVIKRFTGMIPKLAEEQLPDNAATTASNCDFVSGELRGMKAPALSTSSALTAITRAIRSMFVYDATGYQFGWTLDVNAVRGPVASDTYSRFYWSNNEYGGLRVSFGNENHDPWTEPNSVTSTFKVGVPRPKYLYGGAASGEANAKITFPPPPANSLKLAGVSYNSVQWVAVWEDGSGGAVSTTVLNSVNYAAPDYTATKVSIAGIPVRPTAPNDPSTVTTAPTAGAVRQEFQAMIDSGGWYDPLGTRQYLLPINVQNTEVNTPLRYYGSVKTGATTTTLNSNAKNTNYELVLEMRVAGSGQDDFTVRLRHGVSQVLPGAASTYSAQLTYTETSNSAVVTITAAASALETRAYTYTYVNRFGEESAPAPASDVVTIVRNQQVFQYSIPSVQIESGYYPIDKVRVYRTATGTSSTAYLLLAEYSVSQGSGFVGGGTHNDDALAAGLAEPLSTAGYEPAPSDLMGLVAMGNGMLAAFRANEVHVSEPYLPYAWNPANVLTFPNRVMALCATENSLYVLTTANPYLVSGVTPDSLTSQRLPALQAGTTVHCATQINGGIVYASYDGLVFCQGMNATLEPFTKYMSRDTWRDYVYPHIRSIRLSAHAGDLIMTFDNGGGATPGLVFRLEEDGGSLTGYSQMMECTYVSPIDDVLYYKSGSKIYIYRGGGEGDVTGTTNLDFNWQSKVFTLQVPTNFGAMQVIGEGDVVVTVFAYSTDLGVQSLRIPLTLNANDPSGTIVRLPSGFISRRWRVMIEGVGKKNSTQGKNAAVRVVALANTPSELKDV